MSEQVPLVAAPKRRGRLVALVVGVLVAILVVVLILTLVGRGDDETAGAGSADGPVRIGVIGASDPYWDDYVAAAEEAGITVELVDFTDYTQPNPALTEGDLDLNQFQHAAYLAQYNEAADADLQPIGATAVYPLSVYSTRYASLEEIPDGSTVAVANDASNLARGLLVLQAAGLVELQDGGSAFSTLDDILPASRVEVTTLEASLIATSLPDVAAGILNNDFVDDAGLTVDDALFSDDPAGATAEPYINFFAARADDVEDETYLELVDIFQTTPAVTEGLVENSGGAAVLSTASGADLREILSRVESDLEKD